MAIIDKQEVVSSEGIKKGIDENSTSLALDILQRGMYSFPIQSTIRELASNSYDAIKERDVAKSIISGKTTIADHFDLSKDSAGIYTDSDFDASYFDEKWLSDDPKVYIYYEEGKQKDRLRIVDNGVGLGKKRLNGYFQLNYSTKRKNKDALGKWGLGSKVALSLGIPSFRVITRYNGKKFTFDVFLDKVESVIPKFGQDGNNEEVILRKADASIGQKEYIAYCENTTEKNGLELIIEIKKHNKQKFFDAVKTQLMYIPNIMFLHKPLGNMSHKEVDISAKILYKDKDIVIAESTVHNKPHILLGTGDALINYGFVAFNELEIEPKGGAVGLILNINDIEITPSRESPVWCKKTRDAVLKKYKDVTKTAIRLVESQLKNETDYLKWLGAASSTMHALKYGNSSDNDSVIARLASIIDVNAITDVKFPNDASIYLSSNIKEMLGEFVSAWEVRYNSYEKKIERKKVKDIALLSKPIYFIENSANGLIDRYIFEEEGTFIQIRIKAGGDKNKFVKHVMASSMGDYMAITIPADRLALYESEDLVEEEEDAVTTNIAAKNRKLNEEIVIHSLQSGSSTHGRYYSFNRRDRKASELFTNNSDDLCLYSIYGERDNLYEILEMMPQCLLSVHRYKSYNDGDLLAYIDDKRRLSAIMVASENKKYLKGSSAFVPLSDFILDSYNEDTGKLTFSNHIKVAASLSFVFQIVQEKFPNVIPLLDRNEFSYVNESDYKLFQSFAGCWCNNNNGPYKRIGCQPWYKDCIEYHASKLNLIETDEDTVDALISNIDDTIPDVICETITDKILDVDILDVSIIKPLLDVIDYYQPVAGLIKKLSSGYYNNDSDKIEDAKKIAVLCKVLNENPSLYNDWDFPNYLGEVKDDE